MSPPDLTLAANRDWAAHAWERLRAAHPDVADRLGADAAHLANFAAVTGASEAAGDLMVRLPDLLAALAPSAGGPPGPVTADAVSAAALEAVGGVEATDPAAREAFVRVQRAGLLQVAARDMHGAGETDSIAGELAALADGMIRAALTLVVGDPAAGGLSVVAMGKLGGQELNYVSDVDVVFVHDPDVHTDSAAAVRLARQIMVLLGEHSPLGLVYEMDANLRPEGRNGPLSRSVASYTAYWERWAKTWEYQALMKARPVAGPVELGEAFMAQAARFVWPSALGSDAVGEIQAMKTRVETSKPVVRDGERQLKLAPGGLRDIEFAAQLLQLVHGPADATLRVRGTVPALRALAAGGYIDDGDAALFTDAYLFLRTVEHRLQLRQLRRTHTVPSDPEDLHRLARAMGFRDLPVRPAAEAFAKELARVRAGVRRVHAQLFYRPLLATLASYGTDELGVTSKGLDATAVEVRLKALAFDMPGRARRDIEAMAAGSGRSAKQLRVVLPTMLEALASQPDPDGGLAALRTLAEALRSNPRFVRTIRDNPPAARRLAQVLGGAPRLGEWLGRQPEVLDLLDDDHDLTEGATREDMRHIVDGLLKRGGGQVGRTSLRRIKRREALRIALRDVMDHADVVQIGHELTWLGEALLRAGVATVTPPDVRLAIIGLGRFGAAELAHASDMDVLVLHDGPTDAALAAVAELLSFMAEVTPEQKAFRLDVDLRPEGRQGPLTRTLESHLAYYTRWAEPWELQALTQARPVAGDPDLGRAFMDGVAEVVYPDPAPAERLTAIRTMKARVESERAGRPRLGRRTAPRPQRVGHSSSPDLKLGPGGLSDVEWTVQLLQIAHGGADPDVRGAGTLHGLEALTAAGILTSEEREWLRDGWIALSEVRNALYLLKERDTSTMPSAREVQQRLATLLGHRHPQEMVEDLDRARRRIRRVFDRRFFDLPDG